MYKSSITIEGSKNGSGGLLKRKFASLKRKISKKNKNVVKSSSETIYSALFDQFISPRKIYYPYKSCKKMLTLKEKFNWGFGKMDTKIRIK